MGQHLVHRKLRAGHQVRSHLAHPLVPCTCCIGPQMTDCLSAVLVGRLDQQLDWDKVLSKVPWLSLMYKLSRGSWTMDLAEAHGRVKDSRSLSTRQMDNCDTWITSPADVMPWHANHRCIGFCGACSQCLSHAQVIRLAASQNLSCFPNVMARQEGCTAGDALTSGLTPHCVHAGAIANRCSR